MALTDKLTAIADAIRGKTGGTEPLTLAQMPVEIAGIKTDPVLQELAITENGEYTPGEGMDGFSRVTVEVAGKIPERTAWYRPPDWPDLESLPLDETREDFYFTVYSKLFDAGEFIINSLDYINIERGRIEDGVFVVAETYPTATSLAIPILPENGEYQVLHTYGNAPLELDASRVAPVVEAYGYSAKGCPILNYATCEVYTQKGKWTPGFRVTIGGNAFKYIDLSGCELAAGSLYSDYGMPSLQHCRLPVMSGIGAGWQFGRIFSGAINLREFTMTGWNTAAATTMQNLFNNCLSLQRLDISGCSFSNVTNTSGAFTRCVSLRDIVAEDATLPAVSFSLADSSQLTVDSLMAVIAALPVLGDGKTATLTLGAANTKKLAADQIAVATGKGWSVA